MISLALAGLLGFIAGYFTAWCMGEVVFDFVEGRTRYRIARELERMGHGFYMRWLRLTRRGQP